MAQNKDNIAALKKKILRLEKENKLLNNIIRKASIPLFVIDKNHTITHFNQALEELTGLPCKKMVGTQNQWKAFYKTERPVMADLIVDKSSDTRIVKHYGMKYKPSLKEKERFAATDFYPDLGKKGKWLFFTASAFTDGKGNICGAVETLQDVTEEKRIQANNKTILRISTALPEYPGLEDLMDFISKEVKDILNTEGAIVLLHDELKDELFFTGASYDDPAFEQRAKQFRFSMDALLAGRIIKTGEYIMENNPEKLTKGFAERDKKFGYTTKSLLEVPIKSEGRIIGVLCAINKKQSFFDQNDLELMLMIAGTCAISIENARFSDALQDAYRDVASMNRAKGKAINHLSHELKTPVAVLTGSFKILEKKLESFPKIDVKNTLERIERNLNRVVDIQDEVADIMDDKTYSAKKIMQNMLEACKDELETLIEETLFNFPANQNDIKKSKALIRKELEKSTVLEIENSIREQIEKDFGPRSVKSAPINFSTFFKKLYKSLEPAFDFRNIQINIQIQKELPTLVLPEQILEKIISGLIKNAVENTPDHGRIDLFALKKNQAIVFKVHDFGVGIEEDAKKRIFEGFFTTQKTSLYSTKTPFAFNAGGKGADLLRMKIFSQRHGFVIKMESNRCCFLAEDKNAVCPGNIEECKFCKNQKDCLNSGYSVFSVFFPAGHG